MDGREKGKLALCDIEAFNRTMRQYGVSASILARSGEELRQNCKIFPASCCIYRISVFGKTDFSSVIRYEREVLASIAAGRKTLGYFDRNISLRFGVEPFFTLEVDSPPGNILPFENIPVREWQAAVGKTFSIDGDAAFVYDLRTHHQTLIAAISGHGKSQLLKNCLGGLMDSTNPERLHVYCIDFKNTDLLPFKSNPHTKGFAFKTTEANKIITKIKAEANSRIDKDGFILENRILLVIDELAEIDKKNDEALASIMKMGRSLGVHVLAATQHPTAAQIGQKVARSFTHRMVGRVDSANAALWATGAAGTGAESLKKVGSFLYVYGGSVERFQTFYKEENET